MWDWIGKLDELRRQNQLAVLVTVTKSTGSTPRKHGAKMIVLPDGTFFGTVGGGVPEYYVTNVRTSVNGLASDEMVKEIQIPRLPEQLQQTFLKFTLRKPIDFAIVSVAALINITDGVCTSARIALGAVAPGAHRAMAAEEFLKKKPINEETAVQAAELALQGARALSGNAYKIEIAKTLVKRAIMGQNLDDRQKDNLNSTAAYDPTELSTFHRCSFEDSAGHSTVVASGGRPS